MSVNLDFIAIRRNREEMGQNCDKCIECGKLGVERLTKQGGVQVLCSTCGLATCSLNSQSKGLPLHEDPYAHYKRPNQTSCGCPYKGTYLCQHGH